jgi:uncharacterized metal-binding protein YceD (DUF177 family)
MSRTGRPPSDFSRRILAASLGSERKELRIEATPAERDALSRRLDLLGLDRLEADLTIESRHGGAVRLQGTLVADVTQACVVTLEPVKSHIEAPFERIYSAQEKPDDGADDEVAVSLEEGEPAEALVDGAFDAGEAVAEQLALELDPFPRAPGVSFEGYESGGTSEKAESGPFAALSRLKRGSD